MRLRVAIAAVAPLLVGCSSGSSAPPPTLPPAPLPAPLSTLLGATTADRQLAAGDDDWQVWVCHVPLDSTAAIYEGMQQRLDLTPQGVAGILQQRVTPYFETISHGAYRPVFSAGGTIDMGTSDQPQACLDRAIAAAPTSAKGVFAVADAEHGADQPGGFGSPGKPCDLGQCSVASTRRAAYVGASDFHPDWGDRPPMDLVEHELGHALGWVHSGYDPAASPPYQSALDLMSNSAAPRDVDPERRDGPDVLALSRITSGWIPTVDIAVVPPAGGTVNLQPSTGAGGTRVAVVGLSDTEFLTVEVLTDSGFDAHLPASGVAVHRVQFDATLHELVPLVGSPPYTQLLQPGGSVDADGWTISVIDEWTLSIAPTVVR
jgi:hypothetical protein